jgi:hypothetical protein
MRKVTVLGLSTQDQVVFVVWGRLTHRMQTWVKSIYECLERDIFIGDALVGVVVGGSCNGC